MLYINFTSGYAQHMTLTFRNRALFFLFIMSVVFILFLTTAVVFAGLNDQFPQEQIGVRIFSALNTLTLFKYNFFAVLFSIGALLLYVPITLIIMYKYFEKTQSGEILYFSNFMIACLLEGIRLCIFIFQLWETYSLFFLYLMHILVFARILASLVFLTAGLFSNFRTDQEPDQNIYMILAVSITLSMGIPLVTTYVTSTGMAAYAYMNQIFIMRISFAVITALSFFATARSIKSNDYKHVGTGFLFLYSGYLLLCSADNFAFFILGTIFLFGGTRGFLQCLHRYYLWK